MQSCLKRGRKVFTPNKECLRISVFLSPTLSPGFDSMRPKRNATPPRCTEDEKRELYNRLDPSGGGAGVCCVDLVGFVEGPVDDYGGGAVTTTSDTLVAASAALAAFQDEQGAMGKLLRRAQATIVEAAQVLLQYYNPSNL